MSRLLEVEALEARYGQIPVLRGVSMHVGEGESVGLLGANGHGKTTLLRTLSGLLRPSAGSAAFRGADLTSLPSKQIVELGLIHVPQGPRLFPNCTVGETLRLGAFSKHARERYDEQIEQVFALFPRLHERRYQRCGTLSGGERQMVAIGAGLMAQPKLLALDEPTLGLAPKVKLELRSRIEQIRATGVALIVVDGDVDFMLALTDRWYAMELGRITAEAASDVELEDRMVVDMYFKGQSVHG